MISSLYLSIYSNIWTTIFGDPFFVYWSHWELEWVPIAKILLYIFPCISIFGWCECEWYIWIIWERIVDLVILMEIYDDSSIWNREILGFLFFYDLSFSSKDIELTLRKYISISTEETRILGFHEACPVHESIVNHSYLIYIRYKIPKIFLDFIFFSFCELDLLVSAVVSGEYRLEIGIPCQYWFRIPKCENCSRCIFSDSWEFFEKGFISWEYSTIFFCHYFCCLEKIASPRIVSESLIIRKEFIIGCSSEILDGGVFEQYFCIESNNSICLGLLEEDLSEPNSIFIGSIWCILSPWKIMFPI